MLFRSRIGDVHDNVKDGTDILTLFTCELSPTVVTFSKPLQVIFNSPFDKSAIQDMQLFQKVNNVWQLAPIPDVTFANGKYTAGINTLSDYCIGVAPIMSSEFSGTTSVDSMWLNEGRNDITFPKITTKKLTGIKTIVSAEQALQDAGIEQNPELLAFLNYKLMALGATDEYEERATTTVIGLDKLPRNFFTIVTKTNTFTNHKYTYVVDNKNVTLVVQSVETTISATLPVLYDAHHHSNGAGAGGGTGGNL